VELFHVFKLQAQSGYSRGWIERTTAWWGFHENVILLGKPHFQCEKKTSMLRCMHDECGKSFELLDAKVDSVDAQLGHCSLPGLSEHCITSWDGVSYLHNTITSLSNSLKDIQSVVSHLNEQIDQLRDTHKLTSDKLTLDFWKHLNGMVDLFKVFNGEQSNIRQHLQALGVDLSAQTLNFHQEFSDIRRKILPLESAVLSLTIAIMVPTSIFQALQFEGSNEIPRSQTSHAFDPKIGRSYFSISHGCCSLCGN
jgi:hypothetical protein